MSVSTYAFSDMTKYIKENNIPVQDRIGDVWVVTPATLNNKEQRRLNKKLGLKNINNRRRAKGTC